VLWFPWKSQLPAVSLPLREGAALCWGTRFALRGGSIPTTNNGSSIKKSVPTYHKNPLISWHDGFQKKGEVPNAAKGILTRGRLGSENPRSSGVQVTLLYCNESPLVQCPPTNCL